MAEAYIGKRQYPRVKTPVYYNIPGLFRTKRKIVNISLGGIRIHTRDYLEERNLFALEIFLPNGLCLAVNTQVRWENVLPPGANGIYDVGLEFINLSLKIKNHLSLLVKRASS